MKKLFLSLLAVFSFMMTPVNLFSNDPEVVPVELVPSHSGPVHSKPRSLSIPLTVSIIPHLCSISVSILEDVGEMEILVQNINCDESFRILDDGSAGRFSIPFDCASGDYTIIFRLSDGRQFVGYFSF